MRELQMHCSSPARAPQWTILTAARAGEALGATRSEIKSASEFARIAKLLSDLVQGETWVVSAERMKEGKEHHVPLSQNAVALISGCKGKLFPGHERQMMTCSTSFGPVSPFTAFVRTSRIGRPNTITRKNCARWHWLILSANSVEQAYRRSTRLNKRREMMSAWSKFALANCV
jgi:integrase